ncbi:hypothetical protein DXG01_004312 [Tephrocybe rancida]|nr:hypothetical protein DXG01_004312 [Tephrocybe rancida]
MHQRIDHSIANVDRLRSRGIAEPIIQVRPIVREIVAASTARAPITERDIVGSREALGVGGTEACRASIVYAAAAAADVAGSSSAVRDDRVQGGAGVETAALVDGGADVRDVRVSVGEPLVELLDGLGSASGLVNLVKYHSGWEEAERVPQQQDRKTMTQRRTLY